jgi:hypothetical protein
MNKKRELLTHLNNAISALVKMHDDCARLEVIDNNQASKRLKADVSSFVNGELETFRKAVLEVRTEIIKRPRKKDGRAMNPGPRAPRKVTQEIVDQRPGPIEISSKDEDF